MHAKEERKKECKNGFWRVVEYEQPSVISQWLISISSRYAPSPVRWRYYHSIIALRNVPYMDAPARDFPGES